ncbi:MAG TPA: hypothetical protein VHZ74_21955 [Bryobacteraceae bacterium]|jgi:hypothetical protein|nr:hypothetical protein [Bryobacteraceae bacterium]
MKTIALFLALSAASLAAPVKAPRRACQTRDLNGTYAFLADGSTLIPGAPLTGPFMRVGYFTANGKGAIHFWTLAIYNGINFGEESFAGTYSVEADCTFDMIDAVPAPINSNVTFKGQIALGGDQVTFMVLSIADPSIPPLTTVVGFGKIRGVDRCTTESLDGAWAMELHGTRNIPAPGTPGTPTAYRQVGQFQFDGKSGFLDNFLSSNNGVVTPDSGSGTYTVSPDCTFDLTYKLGTTDYAIRGSLIDPDNAFLGLNMPGPTVPNLGILTGAVATGSLTRQSSQPRIRRDATEGE